MNKKVIVASKDIRSKLTKNIISDLNLATNSASLESAPVLERLGTVDKEKEKEARKKKLQALRAKRLHKNDAVSKEKENEFKDEKRVKDSDESYASARDDFYAEDAKARKAQEEKDRFGKPKTVQSEKVYGGNTTQARASWKEAAAPKAASEAQNTRISLMNDIVNAAASIKGMGKSAPDAWKSRKSLAGLSNAELWKLRGEATRAATSANADKAVKKSVSGKAELMKGNGGEKTTLEAGKVRIQGGVKAAKESADAIVLSTSSFEDAKFDSAKEKVTLTKVTKKNVEVGDTIKFTLADPKETFLCEVTKINPQTGSVSAIVLDVNESFKKATGKDVKESQAVSKNTSGLSLAICPLCGSKEFNANESTCPVCSTSYRKYSAVEAVDFEWDNEDDEFTTIDIDGTQKVLIDDEGNTSVISPDELEGQLIEHTHDLVIDDEENPVQIDSGMAQVPAESEGEFNEFEEDAEVEGGKEIAFVKIQMTIEECLDLLQEENEDSIEVVPTDNGYEIVVSLESVEEEGDDEFEEEISEEEEDEDLEDVSESEEPETPEEDIIEIDEEPEEDFEEESDEGDEKVVLSLEELAEGTVISAEGIVSVDSLVDILNQLLPEKANIVDATEDTDGEDVVEGDVAKLKEGAIAEDEMEMAGDAFPMEAAKPKISQLIKAKRSRLKAKKIVAKKPLESHKITETGTFKATRDGKLINVTMRATYESKFPKITKTAIKEKNKVPATGAPSAKSLAQTMESATTRHEFMKSGMEALGSALNTRKLLLSLWDAIKENKPGSATSLLNTLEAALKPEKAPVATAPEAKKEEKKPTKGKKKLETKRIKKLDKVVKFSKS